MNIEKKITQIWVGPKPAPLKWMNTWKEKHPDWEYEIFDDKMLHGRSWKNQLLIDRYYEWGKYQGVSDLIRYELLYERGGFWPEADMVCLENTEELFTSPPDYAYTCYENEKYRGKNVQPIMACNPGNEFLELIIDELSKIGPASLHREPFRSTGNAFLARMIGKTDKLTVWPSHYFIPQFYLGETSRYNGPDKVYADHYWGSTGHKWTRNYKEGV